MSVQARTRFTTLATAALAALLAAGCGGSQESGPTPPDQGKGGATDPGTGTEPSTGTEPTPAGGLGTAPDATVLAEGGAHVQLASAWLESNAVLVFSRGHWCPFCVRQLTSFQEKKQEVEALGGKIVAITADAEDPPKLRQKTGATFTIYSDPDLAAIKAYDVLDAGNSIARPATVIVDKQGRIVFRYAGDNAADTVLIGVVLAELKKLADAGGAAPAGK